MNETTKTAVFVGAMVVFCAAAYMSQPRVAEVSFEEELGQKFFPEFADPLDAARLAIVEYDENTASLHRFEVAKVDGVWSIPSHEGYPTDAERQLAQAAASLIDVSKLGVAGTSREDHETFGVVDPDSAPAGAEGIGKKVTLSGGSDEALAEFIIGKAVKDEEGLRYVRVPGREVVYRVKMDTSKLSTKFEDWIEEDLLELNSFDIRKVTLNNYSIDELKGQIVEGDTLELTHADSKWQLEGLGEDEELVTSKLDDLKTALDTLEIVDVRRKPAGLSSELRTEQGMKLTVEDQLSLQSRGYFIVRGQLLSNEGEVVCTTKDGVVYVLRFGEIAAGTGGGSAGDEEAADEGEEPAAGSNRYIFVTAQFDEAMIPKPELEPLPEAKPAEGKAEEEADDAIKPGEEEPKAGTNDAVQPAEEEADDAVESAKDDAEEKTDDTAKPADGKPEQPDEGSGDAEGTAENEQGSEEDVERQRIEEENKRKAEEYHEKIEKAKESVKELNDRFADWYYVISDEVYRKIHLSRDEIVTKKGPADVEEQEPQPDAPSAPTPSVPEDLSVEPPDDDD